MFDLSVSWSKQNVSFIIFKIRVIQGYCNQNLSQL